MENRIISILSAQPKKLFLADSSGALLTAFFLTNILAKFEAEFGMPKKVLYLLSSIAILYAMYSFYCFLFVSSYRPYLRLIIMANLLYMLATAVLVAYHRESLHALGWIYFTLELLVISILVSIELKVLSKLQDEKD